VVKPEFTGSRWGEEVISYWHRALGEAYSCSNIDFVEWREGKGIVGVFEYKHGFPEVENFKKSVQFKILSELEEKLKVPTLLCYYKTTPPVKLNLDEAVELLSKHEQKDKNRILREALEIGILEKMKEMFRDKGDYNSIIALLGEPTKVELYQIKDNQISMVSPPGFSFLEFGEIIKSLGRENDIADILFNPSKYVKKFF